MAEINGYNRKVATLKGNIIAKLTSTETQEPITETGTTTTSAAGTANAPTRTAGPAIRYEYVVNKDGHYEQVPVGTYEPSTTSAAPTPSTPTPTENPTTTSAGSGPTNTLSPDDPYYEDWLWGGSYNSGNNEPTPTGGSGIPPYLEQPTFLNSGEITPSGTTPSGTTPSGTTPSGTTPSADNTIRDDDSDQVNPPSSWTYPWETGEAPTASGGGTYTVQAGDNLWKICRRVTGYTDNSDIAKWVKEVTRINNLGNGGNLIYPGQVLNLP